MNRTTVKLVSTFGSVRMVSSFGSDSCVSSFGSSPKAETVAVSSFGLTQRWKLRMRFQFWAISTFGPARVIAVYSTDLISSSCSQNAVHVRPSKHIRSHSFLLKIE